MLMANLGRNALRDREVMHGDLPSLHAPLRVVGRGRGWGVYQLARLAASSLRRPPPPTPPAASREGGEEPVRDGGLFENRISTAYAVRNNGGSDARGCCSSMRGVREGIRSPSPR